MIKILMFRFPINIIYLLSYTNTRYEGKNKKES